MDPNYWLGKSRHDVTIWAPVLICWCWCWQVTSLMRSHRLSREDATRALVVRNAVSCLRRKGWDSASVMQELTSQLMASDPPPSLTARQQQQTHPPSPGGFRTGMKRPLSAMGQGLMPGVSDGEDEEEEERKMGARGAVEVAAADEEGGAGGGSDAMMMQLVSPRKRACYGKVPPPSCVGVVGEPAQARDWSMMYSSSSRDHGNTSNHQQHHFHAEPHQQHHLHQYGGAAQW